MTFDRNSRRASPVAVSRLAGRNLEARLAAFAPLADPIRRRLYVVVAESPSAVSREEAAAAVGITRSLAAFHLDRLIAEGLLRTEFARRTGRTGPGAGRPAKLYRPSDEPRAVSLPERNYELAALLFAEALAAPAHAGGPERVREHARAYGRTMGRAMVKQIPESAGERLRGALAAEGFAPRDDGGVMRLGNCPFHALAAAHRELTCGMNLALMSGLLEGLGVDGWQARPDPRPGLCCVAFEPAPSRSDSAAATS